MTIRELDGDDPETVSLLLPGFRRTMAVDLPSDPPVPAQLLGRLLQRRRGTDRLVLAAFQDDQPLGYLKLGIDLQADLRHAHGSLWVFPPHRQTGVGRRLVEAAGAQLLSRARPVLLLDAPRTSSADAFAIACGGRRTATNVRHRLKFDTWDQSSAGHHPAVASIELVRWNDRCPDHLLDPLAAVWSQLDAVVNGQARSTSVVGADVRVAEQEAVRSGHRQYLVAAVRPGSTQVLGYSSLFVRDSPMADTGHTVVVAGLRRKGVATLLKQHLISWAYTENPNLKVLQAWTESDNAAALALNRRIGFEADQRWSTYRFDLTEEI